MRRLALAIALVCAGTSAQGVDDALRVGDLICEFGRDGGRSLIEDLVDSPPRTDLLLVYEAVSPESARVISTQAPGRRPVLVRATRSAVHFIERVGPSVRVTTLTGCERRRLRNGMDTCVRFGARHAWHFDERVVTDPDLAFAELPAGSSPGQCEPWQVD